MRQNISRFYQNRKMSKTLVMILYPKTRFEFSQIAFVYIMKCSCELYQANLNPLTANVTHHI